MRPFNILVGAGLVILGLRRFGKFYSTALFPRLCDLTMDVAHKVRYRKELVARLKGRVLEIGFGTGLNLPYYPAAVRELVVVDPNPGMNAAARKKIERSPIEVEVREGVCEDLPMKTASFDCAVSSWTLCSIKDPRKALRAILRVLKPGGKLYFIEHGRSPDASIQRLQNIINPIHGLIGDGCSLTCDIKGLIVGAGFELEKLKEFYIEKDPKTHGYTYQGVAVKKTAPRSRPVR